MIKKINFQQIAHLLNTNKKIALKLNLWEKRTIIISRKILNI